MPTAGVGRSLNKGLFLHAGSTLNNPVKLVILTAAEGVGVVVFNGVGANRGDWGRFEPSRGGMCVRFGGDYRQIREMDSVFAALRGHRPKWPRNLKYRVMRKGEW